MSEEPFFRLNEAGLAFLRQQWDQLVRPYSANQRHIDDTLSLLTAKYSEPGRAYHNLSHVRALLALSQSIENRIQDEKAVAFAIWFHDAIYDSTSKDNEAQSAELAATELQTLNVPIETVTFVQQLILATRTHSLDIAADDLKVFLDLDLSILGTERGIYREYSLAIRQEYQWVPDTIYRLTRRGILEGFLKRETLYFTPEMAARFEAPARRNLESEIAELSK